jgi:hypothetical protein
LARAQLLNVFVKFVATRPVDPIEGSGNFNPEILGILGILAELVAGPVALVLGLDQFGRGHPVGHDLLEEVLELVLEVSVKLSVDLVDLFAAFVQLLFENRQGGSVCFKSGFEILVTLVTIL